MTTTPGPRTEAGKRLLDQRVPTGVGHEADCPDCQGVVDEERGELTDAILAIEAEARADVDGLVALDVERLAAAILKARSTTAKWKGSARATEPTQWDRIMAKRVLIVLAGDKAEAPAARCQRLFGFDGAKCQAPRDHPIHRGVDDGPDPSHKFQAGDKAEAPE